MAQKASTKPEKATASAVVVFGVDEDGKPKAARFAAHQAGLATKAAGQLKLQVLPIGPAIADLAARLPTGRVHANGRGFLPYIRRDLYAKFIAATQAPNEPAGPPANGSAGKGGKPDNSAPPAGSGGASGDYWDQIAAGHAVIAQDSPTDEWYEAIVVSRDGDMLKLRWRDYPAERRFTCHRSSVAVLPSDVPKGPTSLTAPVSSRSGDEQTVAERTKTSFPAGWANIAADHLVLARDDGPWRMWSAAIVVEQEGDAITLRWRKHQHFQPVIRHRVDLALLCPHDKLGKQQPTF